MKRGLVTVTVCACVYGFWPLRASTAPRHFIWLIKMGYTIRALQELQNDPLKLIMKRSNFPIYDLITVYMAYIPSVHDHFGN
jgi:hypothetical protein